MEVILAFDRAEEPRHTCPPACLGDELILAVREVRRNVIPLVEIPVGREGRRRRELLYVGQPIGVAGNQDLLVLCFQQR